MRLSRWLVFAIPCLLLSYGVLAAPPKKRQAQASVATWKQPTRQAARPPVRRTAHMAQRHALQR